MLRRGVRYYHAVPPPQSDWGRDYAAIAEAGFEFVVVPVPWSLGHVGDDEFDVAPLLRQLDLARARHLGVVAAIDLGVSPGWLTRRHPECLHEDALGRKALPRATRQVPSGGWPGLCLDHGIARAHARRFLQALASAVAAQPALEGYDLSNYAALVRLNAGPIIGCYCHCPATRARFADWLRRSYGDDLGQLRRAWGADCPGWAEAASPAAALPVGLGIEESTPQTLDWLHFQRDNAASQLRECVAALRAVDPSHPTLAADLFLDGPGTADPVALAREVTDWGSPAYGSLPHEAVDHARSAVSPSRLWVTEILSRSAAEAKRANWSLLGSGAHAAVFAAWRTDPARGLTVAPALTRPSGAPSPRLEPLAEFAKWLSGQPALAAARPAPAEAAIVLVPESQRLCAAATLGRGLYEDALRGAYKALTSRGARAEFALPEALGAYPLAYLPMGYAMSAATARLLRRYVEAGGCLVAEACVAQFDERGAPLKVSPGHGLDEVFGARALDVAEETGDERKPLFKGRRATYPCYVRRQPLEATTGKAKATFADDEAAAIVDNLFGAGSARLIGTHPSCGCLYDDSKPCAQVVLDSLAYGKVRPRVLTSSPAVCVRLLEGDDGPFLCAFNATVAPQEATIAADRSVGRFRSGTDLLTGSAERFRGNGRRIKLGPGEGVVFRLQAAGLGRLGLRPRWRRKK